MEEGLDRDVGAICKNILSYFYVLYYVLIERLSGWMNVLFFHVTTTEQIIYD